MALELLGLGIEETLCMPGLISAFMSKLDIMKVVPSSVRRNIWMDVKSVSP